MFSRSHLVARLLLVLFLASAFGSWPRAAMAETATSKEYALKAAFLYNFAKFVSWPEQRSASDSPVLFCVVGDDPFEGRLAAVLRGRSLDGSPLEVLHLTDATDARRCHVAFVASSETCMASSALSALEGTPVLTVGETQAFSDAGGMIRFRIEDNRVRFDVNMAAARAEGIEISSKLLSLARKVND